MSAAEVAPKQEIFGAISRVMVDIGAVGKDRRNPQQGYQFRGIDDIYNVVHAAFAAHGVFVVPEVIDRSYEERQSKSGGTIFRCLLTIRHRFYAGDGSYVDAVTIGEAMDSSDKATNKSMSNAMKYALIEVLAIPTEEPRDAENDHPETTQRTAPPMNAPARGVAAERVAAERVPGEDDGDPQPTAEDVMCRAVLAARSKAELLALVPQIKLMPLEEQARIRSVYGQRNRELS